MDDHLLRLQREAVTQFMRMDEDLTAEDSGIKYWAVSSIDIRPRGCDYALAAGTETAATGTGPSDSRSTAAQHL